MVVGWSEKSYPINIPVSRVFFNRIPENRLFFPAKTARWVDFWTIDVRLLYVHPNKKGFNMPLAEFNPSYRMIWMFPRNKRRISPWKMAQIAVLFRTETQGVAWSGNQAVQNAFCKALEDARLKKKGVQYDPASGGPRTYFAQLKSLGLLFQDQRKKVYFTKAGDALASGEAPLPILQDLLLRHQYPSCYGSLPMISMNPGIRIKPFLFVLKLLSKLGKMSEKELVIPVVYGHMSDCFDLCLNKIYRYRESHDFHDVIDNYERDLYTPRTAGKSFESRIKDVQDIANTMKNWMQAVCLVDCESSPDGQVISISPSAKSVIAKHIAASEVFLEYESEESFQRKYGCIRCSKDTRDLRKEQKKASPEKNIILSRLYEYMGSHMLDDYPDGLVEELHNDFGFDEKMISDTIGPHLKKSLSFFSSTYLELAAGGIRTAVEFEKATAQILSSKLRFTARLTGQKWRKGKGGYSDIFVIALDQNHCGIIDGKATSSYTLPASDYYAMCSNYIPNYGELTEGKKMELEFCSYVAGGFTRNVKGSLQKITANSGIGASALPADVLLRLAQMPEIGDKQPLVRETLKQNKILGLKDFKLNG